MASPILASPQTDSSWLGKEAILAASGFPEGHWTATIQAHLGSGEVERQGERRGLLYRRADGAAWVSWPVVRGHRKRFHAPPNLSRLIKILIAMSDRPDNPQTIPPGVAALLTLSGEETEGHEVRAETLATLLVGLQRVAYLLGAAECGQEIGARLKPSRAMRERFSLRCGVPQMGSYALPLDVGRVGELDVGPPLLERLRRIWAALADQDGVALRVALPESVAQRVLREIATMLPKMGGLSVSLQTAQTPAAATLTWRTARYISEQLAPRVPEDTVMTITGELLRIDFAARQVTILYPPTRREIVCTYLPEIEDSIVESRKEPIQVTGRFVLDEDGNPSKLMDVSRIEPIDLSPLVVTDLERLPVRMKEPLVLVPSLDEESQQYVCVADTDLGLDAFALTREYLFDEVQAQLAMLWQEYACAPDGELDAAARVLKAALLARMEDAHAEG